MGDHVYKIIELTGSSSDGIEQAVQNAVTRAGKTLENLRWLEIINTRAQIVDNAIAHWQVTIKVGFTLNEPNTL